MHRAAPSCQPGVPHSPAGLLSAARLHLMACAGALNSLCAVAVGLLCASKLPQSGSVCRFPLEAEVTWGHLRLHHLQNLSIPLSVLLILLCKGKLKSLEN